MDSENHFLVFCFYELVSLKPSQVNPQYCPFMYSLFWLHTFSKLVSFTVRCCDKTP